MNKIVSYTILAMILMGLLISCEDSPKAWVVSTLAGSGTAGSKDGDGDAAQFDNPRGVAVDSLGNIYVADERNNLIRKISPERVVSTFAGSGTPGSENGTGRDAQFNNPSGVAVDTSGNIYVADSGNHQIRKITPGRVVSTIAGSGTEGSANGAGTAAQFREPAGVAVDTSGNIYVADARNHQIRKISPEKVVSTLAGSGTAGSVDEAGERAGFDWPTGVAVDTLGNIYVAGNIGHRIRKITPAGEVSTLAGGAEGFADRTGTKAQFDNPKSVAVDTLGNIYVADSDNLRIRKITPEGVVSTLAGSETAGSKNGAGRAAQFNNPTGVAVDTLGNIYVADRNNNRIRKIEYKVP